MYTIYKNFNIKKELNHVALSAEAIRVLEVMEDDFTPHRVSGPSEFLSIISPKLNLSKYDKYIVYTFLVKDYTRVTDHKKIWGLKNIDNKSLYDNNYLIDDGKVYFGISKGEGNEIGTHEILIYSKNCTRVDFDAIFKIFNDNSFTEFVSNDKYNIVSDSVRRLINDSIVMYFDYSNQTLHIFKNGIEKYISERDLPIKELIVR